MLAHSVSPSISVTRDSTELLISAVRPSASNMDMRIVLRKVEHDGFDTNASVDAISGMAGAIDGITSVENRTLAGKIIVYPMLHNVGLIPLGELGRRFPTVAEKLDGGKWTRAAEQELIRVANDRA